MPLGDSLRDSLRDDFSELSESERSDRSFTITLTKMSGRKNDALSAMAARVESISGNGGNGVGNDRNLEAVGQHWPGSASNSFSSRRDSTGGGAGGGNNTKGLHTDDDSMVSSHPSAADDDSDDSSDDDSSVEVAALTRNAEADVENARALITQQMQPPQPQIIHIEGPKGEAGPLPRTRREWCIVIFAILLILAIAIGTSIGLGYFFVGNSGDTTTRGSSGGVGGTQGGGTGNPDLTGGASNPPSTTPVFGGSGKPLPAEHVPEELAASITWHVIREEISDVSSFASMTDEEAAGGEDTRSPQQRARDFLVFDDVLPEALEDDLDSDSNNGGGEGGDDVLAEEGDDVLMTQGSDVMVAAETKPDHIRGTKPYLRTTTPAHRVAQRYSMAVLYHALNGREWNSDRYWLEPGVHECDFVGVVCEEIIIPAVSLAEALELDELPEDVEGVPERIVVAIDLPENGLRGELPREIAGLPMLRRLNLWSNAISGSIPSQVGTLSNLVTVKLDDNALTGYVPSDLGRLASVKDLSLSLNPGIQGRIPAELGSMSSLESLDLSGMSLRGGIPTALGRLEGLTRMYLHDNRLGGTLPDEYGGMTSLEELVLSGNGFVGEVPASWSNLKNLKRLELQFNDLEADLDGWCSMLRTGRNSKFGRDTTDDQDAAVGGLLDVLVADCGEGGRVRCDCCTRCAGLN